MVMTGVLAVTGLLAVGQHISNQIKSKHLY